MLILTRGDVRQLIDIEPIIDAVEAAHAALANGQAHLAVDAPIPLPGGSSILLPMGATIDPTLAGMKLLTDSPNNPHQHLPTQTSTITVIDPATGQCAAFLDGVEITLHRTAAATAVATRHLARADARVLGLIGAGAQARSHLAALRTVGQFDTVVVWSRTRASAVRLADELGRPDLPIRVLDTPEAVTRAADVLCTLTPSQTPIIQGDWLTPGMHINAVGAPPRPDYREIDSSGIAKSRVIADDRATALSRSGEVCIPIAEKVITPDHIHADLGQIITRTHTGRSNMDQITLFNSVGLAIQDLAATQVIIDRAVRHGVGTHIDLATPTPSERRAPSVADQPHRTETIGPSLHDRSHSRATATAT